MKWNGWSDGGGNRIAHYAQLTAQLAQKESFLQTLTAEEHARIEADFHGHKLCKFADLGNQQRVR